MSPQCASQCASLHHDLRSTRVFNTKHDTPVFFCETHTHVGRLRVQIPCCSVLDPSIPIPVPVGHLHSRRSVVRGTGGQGPGVGKARHSQPTTGAAGRGGTRSLRPITSIGTFRPSKKEHREGHGCGWARGEPQRNLEWHTEERKQERLGGWGWNTHSLTRGRGEDGRDEEPPLEAIGADINH